MRLGVNLPPDVSKVRGGSAAGRVRKVSKTGAAGRLVRNPLLSQLRNLTAAIATGGEFTSLPEEEIRPEDHAQYQAAKSIHSLGCACIK